MAVKTKTYDAESFKAGRAEGEKLGYDKRDKESFARSPDFWRWQECFAYNLTSAVAVLAVLLTFWLVGAFIRWEVGPIPPAQPIFYGGTSSGLGTSIAPYSVGNGTVGSCATDERGGIHCR